MVSINKSDLDRIGSLVAREAFPCKTGPDFGEEVDGSVVEVF